MLQRVASELYIFCDFPEQLLAITMSIADFVEQIYFPEYADVELRPTPLNHTEQGPSGHGRLKVSTRPITILRFTLLTA